MKFDKCKICGDYDWLNNHQCKPKYEVCFDYEKACENEDCEKCEGFYGIHASDCESAIEKACGRYDPDRDYAIITNEGSDCVAVREFGETEWKKYSVSAEMIPNYTASEIE